MVVLEPVAVSAAQPAPGSPTLVGGKSNSSSGSASALRHHPSQYLPMSPYLQPPPHEVSVITQQQL